jgi:hypothetical protein
MLGSIVDINAEFWVKIAILRFFAEVFLLITLTPVFLHFRLAHAPDDAERHAGQVRRQRQHRQRLRHRRLGRELHFRQHFRVRVRQDAAVSAEEPAEPRRHSRKNGAWPTTAAAAGVNFN